MEASETIEDQGKRVRKRGKAGGGGGPPVEVEAARPIRTTRETVAIEQLRPGAQQYRKHFDERKLAELTESIRRLGVQQPIWARPAIGGDEFEIIAGERRWRAAKLAGLTSLTVDVKRFDDGSAVDDETALELAIVENNQRSDPHPLEESDAFVALRDRYHHTAEQIAAKIRRSTGYVYERLALERLGEAGRKAMWDGTIGLAVAHALSRISHPKTQDEAVKELTRNRDEDSGPVQTGWARDRILRGYMLRIADAPFETADTELVPKAGACGACPKRSGNQALLFETAGFGKADVCTDVACWNDKKKASDDKTLAAAKASGREVITKAQAKKDKLFSQYGGDRLESKTLVDLQGHDYQLTGDKTWNAVLGPKRLAELEPVYIQAPSGALIQAARRAKVLAVLKSTPAATDTAGIKELRKPKSKGKKPQRSAKDEGPQKWEIEKRALSLAIGQLVGEVEGGEHGPDRGLEISRAVVLAAAAELVGAGDIGEVLVRRGWLDEEQRSDPDGEFELFLARVPEMAISELRGLLVELAMYFCTCASFDPSKRLLAVAEIDPKTFENAARADLDLERLAEPAPSKGKKRGRGDAMDDAIRDADRVVAEHDDEEE